MAFCASCGVLIVTKPNPRHLGSGTSVSIADLENGGNIPQRFSAAAPFSADSYGEVPSGKGRPLPLCIRRPDYSLWLPSNLAALTGYCRQCHSYDSTLLVKLNLFFTLAAAADCVTFTDDGWDVSHHWLLR